MWKLTAGFAIESLIAMNQDNIDVYNVVCTHRQEADERPHVAERRVAADAQQLHARSASLLLCVASLPHHDHQLHVLPG